MIGEPLTYDEMLAGRACHGCGRPLIPRRKRRDDNEAFLAKHLHCHSSKWTMQYADVKHCSKCCPPPPMSEQQVDQIANILRGAFERSRADRLPQGKAET